jgi:hypothetical protein
MDRKNPKSLRTLGDELLEHVVGGQFISKIPDPSRPKPRVPGSIAQGDTLDNTLTFDQLP